jgi:hypothetical protein
MNTKRFIRVVLFCASLLAAGCFNYAIPALPDDESTISENVDIDIRENGLGDDPGSDLDTVPDETDAETEATEPPGDADADGGDQADEGAADPPEEDAEDPAADDGELPPARLCDEAATLEQLAICIAGHMPDEGSEGFVVPGDDVRSDWSVVVREMLGGRCDDIALPSSLASVYALYTFVDGDNLHSYCVLMEILDEDSSGRVDRGWGTFITNPDAEREINVQAAHPLSDTMVEVEGIGIFKGVGARSYLLAGSHRDANTTPSVCQASYPDSDVAHNIANLFQTATVQTKSFYDVLGTSFIVFQFHGMAATTCPGVNVYLTHGLSGTPGATDRILTLQTNLRAHNPTWVISVPGDDPPCSLNGTTNVQGIFLNGIAAGSVCTTMASASTGIFYYTEQILASRNAVDWIDAIIETWP